MSNVDFQKLCLCLFKKVLAKFVRGDTHLFFEMITKRGRIFKSAGKSNFCNCIGSRGQHLCGDSYAVLRQVLLR